MRVIDTPITEHGFAGLGVGAALAGPQADRRVHDLQFRHAGHGPAHQLGGEDALHVGRPDGRIDRVPRPERSGGARRRPAQPGLYVLVLAHPRAQGGRALYRRRRQGPAQIRHPRSQSRSSFSRTRSSTARASRCPSSTTILVPIGKAKIARAGTDVTIVAWSIGMTYALKAADELAKDNISAEVIDLRTLKPMDTETIIASVKKTGRIVTVEEGWRQSGVGAEIAASRDRAGLRLARRAGDRASPARTCRCPTQPISKSSRCLRSRRWSRRRRRSVTGEEPDEQFVSSIEYPAGRERPRRDRGAALCHHRRRAAPDVAAGVQ